MMNALVVAIEYKNQKNTRRSMVEKYSVNVKYPDLDSKCLFWVREKRMIRYVQVMFLFMTTVSSAAANGPVISIPWSYTATLLP